MYMRCSEKPGGRSRRERPTASFNGRFATLLMIARPIVVPISLSLALGLSRSLIPYPSGASEKRDEGTEGKGIGRRESNSRGRTRLRLLGLAAAVDRYEYTTYVLGYGYAYEDALTRTMKTYVEKLIRKREITNFPDFNARWNAPFVTLMQQLIFPFSNKIIS